MNTFFYVILSMAVIGAALLLFYSMTLSQEDAEAELDQYVAERLRQKDEDHGPQR